MPASATWTSSATNCRRPRRGEARSRRGGRPPPGARAAAARRGAARSRRGRPSRPSPARTPALPRRSWTARPPSSRRAGWTESSIGWGSRRGAAELQELAGELRGYEAIEMEPGAPRAGRGAARGAGAAEAQARRHHRVGAGARGAPSWREIEGRRGRGAPPTSSSRVDHGPHEADGPRRAAQRGPRQVRPPPGEARGGAGAVGDGRREVDAAPSPIRTASGRLARSESSSGWRPTRDARRAAARGGFRGEFSRDAGACRAGGACERRHLRLRRDRCRGRWQHGASGGGTAPALGEERQVLCITHLPQVASLAQTHFRIEKSKPIDRPPRRSSASTATSQSRSFACWAARRRRGGGPPRPRAFGQPDSGLPLGPFDRDCALR